MHKDVSARLIRLNQEFYQTFAEPFSDTRGRIQPGVQRVIAEIPVAASVLDLGCGNGSLSIALAGLGHQGNFTGIDASASLIQIAAAQCPHPRASFYTADLTTSAWLLIATGSYDYIFSFATFHHLPGIAIQSELVRGMADRLAANGQITISAWNFLESQRLRERILPWLTVGIEETEVDPGDYLLDWRRGGVGYRYVHHYTESDLTQLAGSAGLRVTDTFYSDGKSGSLGLYQTWQK